MKVNHSKRLHGARITNHAREMPERARTVQGNDRAKTEGPNMNGTRSMWWERTTDLELGHVNCPRHDAAMSGVADATVDDVACSARWSCITHREFSGALARTHARAA